MNNVNQLETCIVGPGYVRTVGRSINTYINTPDVCSRRHRAFMPATDVVETKDSYHINVDLPGIESKDVEVILSDGVLGITAEYKENSDGEPGARLLRSERQIGRFNRSLRVGRDIDSENIEAQHKNGVLRITLPKLKESQARKVEVLAG